METAIIKTEYIVMSKEEWSADMVPLIAAEFRGVAEQFAAYWTDTHHRTFNRNCQAGVYDAHTGELLTGYKNGSIIIQTGRTGKRYPHHMEH